MRKNKLILLLSLMSFVVLFSCKRDDNAKNDRGRTLNRILFGSCSSQHNDIVGIYNYMGAQYPDLYLAMGDNIYGDFFAILPGTYDYMRMAYENMLAKPEVKRFYDKVETLAVWDDHDFGQNDGVIDNTAKYYAKTLLFDNFKVAPDDPRRFNPSGEIYANYEYGDEAHRVQIILLDNRWNRTPYAAPGPLSALSGYDSIVTPDARMMSDEQWAWLEAQFKRPAKLRFVVSGTQFSASYNGGEAWSVMPNEKRRMVELIKSTRVNGLAFLSGDVHFGDENVLKVPDCYPIFDFTSSGLTHYTSSPYASTNRIKGSGAPYAGLNFGQIDIDWNKTPIEYTVTIRNSTAKPVITRKISVADISF